MLRFYGDRFYALIQALARSTLSKSDFPLSGDQVASISNLLNMAEKDCEEMGLIYSARRIKRLQEDLRTEPADPEIASAFYDVQKWIFDELSGKLFMLIPSGKADFYEKRDLFGSEVADNFQSAGFDIEEAGRCYALARYTACVFHLMRALEVPLRLLAKDLGVPENDNWNKVLNSFNNMLERLQESLKNNSVVKPADWKKRESFYSEASALLRNVKNAWRNDVMHLEKKYTEEEAERIFSATKYFMKFLATRLSE